MMFQWIQSSVQRPQRAIVDGIRRRMREKAIEKAKSRILLHGKKWSDFQAEELEIIVKEEEDKIKSDLKTKAIYGVLILLGIQVL